MSQMKRIRGILCAADIQNIYCIHVVLVRALQVQETAVEQSTRQKKLPPALRQVRSKLEDSKIQSY